MNAIRIGQIRIVLAHIISYRQGPGRSTVDIYVVGQDRDVAWTFLDPEGSIVMALDRHFGAAA